METRKAHARRLREGFYHRYCRGRGIDIGVGRIDTLDGEDALPVPGIDTWDKDDGDATFMLGVADETYDFVYASHILEHIANAHLALKNWWRILRPGGHLILFVPHRDLYEKRTRLPSRWNGDHKFFLLPHDDDLPFTLGLAPLVRGALQDAETAQEPRVCAEGHTIVDPNVHSDGEYSIELVVRKPLRTDAGRREVRREDIHSERARAFRHSGKLGDVVYSLPTVRAMGGGEIFLNADGRYGMGPDAAAALLPLLRAQPFVTRAEIWRGEPYDVDLDAFRGGNPGGTNLADCHLDAFGLRHGERDVAWIEAPGAPPGAPDVVFARSLARRGVPGFWETCVPLLGARAVFLGTADERRAFCAEFGETPYVETLNLLEAARTIAGARLFVGNQSCPLALAEGLKRRVIVEVDPDAPNCVFTRRGALHISNPEELSLIEGFVFGASIGVPAA